MTLDYAYREPAKKEVAKKANNWLQVSSTPETV
jgi:hypothetical protein